MENLLDVVAERDQAVNYLETGTSGEPEPYWTLNPIGVGHIRRPKEFSIPRHLHPQVRKNKALLGKWTHHYLRLLREKQIHKDEFYQRRQKRWRQRVLERYPDAEFD